MAARSTERGGGAGRAPLLVAGFGTPWQRDLDFGNRFVACAALLRWPDRVVVEDLSYSALLVLQRIDELRPSKLVLVGAVARGDRPGTVRRHRLGAQAPPPDEVHEHLVQSLDGSVDVAHTLAVLRYWSKLPPDTVMVEVEPADTSFGMGFTDDVADAIAPVLRMVGDEVGAADLAELVIDEEVLYRELRPVSGGGETS